MARIDGPAPRSLAERIGYEDAADISAALKGLDEQAIADIIDCWAIWARPEQLPPVSHWHVWLMLAGRGFGKTRAGAEWVHHMAESRHDVRIALVGPTDAEARAVMVEGASGILASGMRTKRPRWEPSVGRLTWPSGATGHLYSGANPEALRGPEHDYAWCDELAKWEHGEASWNNLMLGLRRGARPQVLATTTPRPSALIKRLMESERTALTRGRTFDNTTLSADYIAA